MAQEITHEVVGNEIHITRVYNATKEQLFSMFKDPAHLEKWWGPTTWPATIKSYDFRNGGVWHYYMQGPDGTKAWGKAILSDIHEPDTLSFTDAFSDEDGNVDASLPQGKVTFTFEETEGKTTLKMRGVYQSPEEAQKLVQMGMIEGMKDTWTQLAKLVEATQS